jgi:xanthine dehydrogenase large subunit
VSEVEVDGFTGQYRLLRTDILHDVGDSLSPLVDRGQVEGGFVQGVGWLTTEELVWGATARSCRTARRPTSCRPRRVPARSARRVPRARREPGVVHGSKAVGEPPLMLAISVREALRAAVAAFGAGGIVELASPATPEAVFWAIERVSRLRSRVGASTPELGARPDRGA